MVQYAGDNASQFTTEYGNVSKASVGAIQRGLLELEIQGGDQFFGEPMLDVFDLIRTHSDGRGIINILAADQLISRPKVYATFLLWLLAELYERLPEAGDLDKPKMVFFFDEAHLLFEDAPEALQDKIEQVVRLIRSKGVGIYFVTQNPKDVPDKVLAQLGNRVQHALRAFTPLEQKTVKVMAQTFRPNPNLDIEKVITELGTGEALVSFLEEKGTPAITHRAFVCPPRSHVGAITSEERRTIIQASLHYGRYERVLDRESAFEVIKKRNEQQAIKAESDTRQQKTYPAPRIRYPAPAKRTGSGRSRDSLGETLAKSTVRSIGNSLGRQILRGLLGSIFGKR
jgi:DNA helicase HerA-like ATPase